MRTDILKQRYKVIQKWPISLPLLKVLNWKILNEKTSTSRIGAEVQILYDWCI